MKTICFYFQVHQPFRLRKYRFFDIGNDHYYYDDYANRTLLRKIAEKCYLPANEMIYDLIKKHGNKFKVSYSITGPALEQFAEYAPEVLESFKKLAKTGKVEFLAETYSHSLVSLKSKDEFIEQISLHKEKIQEYFDYTPKVFRNTELVYSDAIGEIIAQQGFKAMLTEGAKHILGWKSPNYLYYNAHNPKLKLLLKNYILSDDIAFRFSDKNWESWPLTPEKYLKWLDELPAEEEVVNLFMDYETFGEHQWKETGIFEFMQQLPAALLRTKRYNFATPTEIASKHDPIAPLNVPYPISWADEERDLTAWLGNELQQEAFNKLYELAPQVKLLSDEDILKDWHKLQTSDHFYYMCTKFFADGDVHQYFNPFSSPYDAFINYMNILSDFQERVNVASEELKNIEASGDEDLSELINKYEATLKKLKKEAAGRVNGNEKRKEKKKSTVKSKKN